MGRNKGTPAMENSKTARLQAALLGLQHLRRLTESSQLSHGRVPATITPFYREETEAQK